MKNLTQVTFTTIIQKDVKMDVTFIPIEFDVEKTFGKKRLKIKVWFDAVLYRGLLTKYNGVYHIIINKQIRAQLGKQAGDTVKVKIIEDVDSRTIELPEFMLEFFKEEKELKLIFDKMSYTHHKEYVEWLSNAKKEETKQNRMIKFKNLLQEKFKNQ